MMDHSDEVAAWFTSPVYSRYWRHYHQAMTWHRRHWHAYQKALEAAYGPCLYPQQYPPASYQRYSDWNITESKDRWVAGHPTEDVCDEEGSSDNEIVCDVSNMEITQELRQYFAQTEKHREELKKQQLEAEQQDSYVPADQDFHRGSWRSSEAPPSERPGQRRAAEMKKLYGQDAARIQGMEAALQLTFDRNCDRKQPKYWPVIPLRL